MRQRAAGVSPATARARSGLAALTLVGLLVAGCGGGAPILANPPLVITAPAAPSPTATPPADPIPISFPRDDAAHHRLTEWWYYTGHLVAADGRHFGFEAVIFRAERGDLPVSWASHLALTDESGSRFLYAQRSQIGPAVDRAALAGSPGFDLAITGADPAIPESLTRAPWRLAGSDGHDRIDAAVVSPLEVKAAGGAFGLGLDLISQKPPALHNGNGWIDFDGGGSSYYYSRTRMAVTGSLTLGATALAVTGEAWFDHQWGDFIAVGGGWDWFAVELGDGTDLTISLVRGAGGSPVLSYGTVVDAAGQAHHLDAGAFKVTPTATWTSPTTGIRYPAGWQVELPGEWLSIALQPTVEAQELDTRPTTGVVYWEGSQRVTATRNGKAIDGEAYVELTGYTPGGP